MYKNFILLLLFFVMSLSSFMVAAVESDVINMMSVKQRLERVERMVSSDTTMNLVQQIEALQEEVAMLRGQIDQQGYELNTIKQRQHSLYLDMDRRINAVESSAPAPSSSAVVVKSSDPASVTPSATNNGKPEYDKAYSLLKEGRYKQSIAAFESFVKKFPDSNYGDNAQYWLGEANYAYRQYKQALTEFQRLIAKYPDSPKAYGARLKVAYVYYELKNWSAAKESLQQIIKLYPKTKLSKKANARLARIKREGH